MKKTILLLAIVGVFFTACKKEKGGGDENPSKKLPTMEIESWDGGDPDTTFYTYDANHRLIKIVENGYYTCDLSYNSDAKLIKISSTYDNGERYIHTITYNGNTLTMVDSSYSPSGSSYATTSTVEINDKQQLISKVGGNWNNSYTYDANGSITQFVFVEGGNTSTTTYTPSTSVKGIFRHSNTSDWFFTFWFSGIYAKNGYMPARMQDGDWFSNVVYQTDSDGYVTSLTDTYSDGAVKTSTFTYKTIQ